MHKQSWLLLIFLVASTLLFYLVYFLFLSQTGIKQVCINSNCFDVEIADTPEKHEQGLMFRDSLDGDKGMLFLFDREDRHSFWMKNTLIPLDIIWISQDMGIVDIQTAQPCNSEICQSFTPKSSSLYVLEINSGLSEESNFSLGNKVEFRR